MFYATDMLPSRQKVYKDYKIHKPKCVNMMFYIWKKREKKRHTQTKRSKKYTVQQDV